MAKTFLLIGSIAMAIAIGLGAFGAHGLKSRLTPAMLDIYQTAVAYHVYHALGLIAVGYFIAAVTHSGLMLWSGWLMVAGIVLFSGSLYLLSISGLSWLGAITPIGGVAWIGAWILFAFGVVRDTV